MMIMIMVVIVVVMVVMIVVAIRAAFMIVVVIVRVEEMRIVLQRAFQVEGARSSTSARSTPERVVRWMRAPGLMARTVASTSCSSSGVTRSVLLRTHDIGKGDLVFGLARILQAQRQVLGIDQRDDGIELGLVAHVLVHEEGLGDRHRIGKAGGLDDDGVEAAGPAHQAFDDAHQVAAHRAADAAIVHLVDFFVGFHDQVVVDADLAEFVDDDRVFLAMVLGKDAVEQASSCRRRDIR